MGGYVATMSVPRARSSEARRPLPASTGRRFASALIDGGVFVVVLVAGTMLFADSSDPIPTATWFAVVASFVQLLPETLSGRTVGKLVTGTKVVDSDGNKPSARQILARRLYASRVFISAYSLLREVRARHDRLAGTFVVSTTQPGTTSGR